MSAPRTYQNLVLSGFMGAGKTSVGRILARLLDYRFVDTDALIEKRAGRSVAEVFARDGEDAFRELERQVVADLAQSRRTVIATGGGMTANQENLDSLKQHALVVCLWVTPESIWQRVKNNTDRPLLHADNPREKINQLLAAREPFYKQADVLVHAEQRSAWEVARQVMHAYQQARAACP
ncbi:MAG: shikimate kinase [Verrucomicrobia bacterium]|nr:shikimate kinase [Verrucomicrobiota bacterium]